ncbi:MAG: hypothetical protein LH660_14445, partial [Phormidesmis sp. CAN_BIN36]|nr:hypothetical protein [Phormidesmis sp. CAN_BIN36]
LNYIQLDFGRGDELCKPTVRLPQGCSRLTQLLNGFSHRFLGDFSRSRLHKLKASLAIALPVKTSIGHRYTITVSF